MLLDYSVFSKRVDLAVEYKAGFVDIVLRLGSKGSEVKIRISEKEFNEMFEKLQKAYVHSK